MTLFCSGAGNTILARWREVGAIIRTDEHVQIPARGLCAALITITWLSIFVGRVDASNDPAQGSTQVDWPAGYSPKTADIYSHNEVVIHANPSTVWHYLVAAEQWPSWYSNARNVKISNSEHILRPGSKFSWNTFGGLYESTVAEYVPNERLAWFTEGTGIRTAYHSWLLIPVADGCRLVSEKVDYGPNLTSSAASVDQGLRHQVNQLKAICESHPNLSASSKK